MAAYHCNLMEVAAPLHPMVQKPSSTTLIRSSSQSVSGKEKHSAALGSHLEMWRKIFDPFILLLMGFGFVHIKAKIVNIKMTKLLLRN